MNLSKGTKTLENSDDLLIEILLRLPSESLFKFACVSTRWNGIITDSWFRKVYLERTRRSFACSYPHGRLLGLVQTNANRINRPFAAEHRFLPVCGEEYVHPAAHGTDFFPVQNGYFITSSKDGICLCGRIPHTYYVGNPITRVWKSLPIPPLPEGFPKNSISIGLSSNAEDDGLGGKVIHFRVIAVTGCEIDYENENAPGSKVIPMETYSSRTRKWRRSRLLSEIPVRIENEDPPTFSGGFFHWFTDNSKDVVDAVAFDPSSLDEEDDNCHGGLALPKKHVIEVIKIPKYLGSKIIWRSENRQTMWFGISMYRGSVEVYRKRDSSDDWACISTVGIDIMTKDIIGITEQDIKNEELISGDEIKYICPDRECVYLIAFTPWDPKLVVLRYWDKIYIYDCIQKKLVHEVMLKGDREFTTNGTWYPYFHSLSN